MQGKSNYSRAGSLRRRRLRCKDHLCILVQAGVFMSGEGEGRTDKLQGGSGVWALCGQVSSNNHVGAHQAMVWFSSSPFCYGRGANLLEPKCLWAGVCYFELSSWSPLSKQVFICRYV